MNLQELGPATRGEPQELPNAPGYWVVRDADGDEHVTAVFRDEDGDMRWHSTGRPIMNFDRGIYYGPYRLSNV